MTPDIVPVPIGWMLASLGGLAACIGTLAAIIYSQLNSRIMAQNEIITKLQSDVSRLSQGCGANGCHWKSRRA